MSFYNDNLGGGIDVEIYSAEETGDKPMMLSQSMDDINEFDTEFVNME